ncbi:VOC family protein [Symmachiella dynata]|uniref:VOC family protein n=1 Tax=Symmachiella dynata TaxID=2527995 RepID=UPI0018D2DDF9|nr:hypothetical protein [Symmachiella dynata]
MLAFWSGTRELRLLVPAGTPIASQSLPPVKETEWGKRAVVRDPDGRAVQLYQK